MSADMGSGSETPADIDSGGRPPPIAAPPDASPRPFFSVMIPTYNPERPLLIRAVESVLSQAGADLHIELVDDASPGFDPAAFAAEIRDDRLRWFRQPRNLGYIRNWNACVDRASGEWVHVFHQDDLVLPGFYAALRQGLAGNSRPGAAVCRHSHLREGKVSYVSPLEREQAGIVPDYLDRIARMQRIQFASIVVRRSVYQAVGGFDP